MFQLNWANKELWQPDNLTELQPSRIQRRNISSVLKVRWEEHCVECAIPECYTSCPIYKKRKDGKCARFVYGIFRNKKFSGHYDFGADILFRKWGKLEAWISYSYPIKTVSLFNKLLNLNYFITRKGIGKRRNPQNFPSILFDEFVVECHSVNTETYNLICEYFLEIEGKRVTKFRHVFMIKHGYNFFSIPFDRFKINTLHGYLYLYPENSDPPKRIIFTWLDFVKYKSSSTKANGKVLSNRNHIKCVAWDLDNTLWDGILIEQDRVKPFPQAIDLIKKLDERGIIQTIVSKNDFNTGWNELQKIGIDQYFIHPAINWNPKSENIKEIAKKLNIGIDSIALIDDSKFEREEVKCAIPEAFIYSNEEIPDLIYRKEFNIPISNESRTRRMSYKNELERDLVRGDFKGTYDDFLRSCEMKAVAFTPVLLADIERCYELIQRSNQLNLSTNRYSRENFQSLVAGSHTISIAIRCKDRFGDYGIIGFASLNLVNEIPVLENFVISCRIAQKGIELAFLKRLVEFLKVNGYKQIMAKLIQTPRNTPLSKIFLSLPFVIDEEKDNLKSLLLDTGESLDVADIMDFKWEVLFVTSPQ